MRISEKVKENLEDISNFAECNYEHVPKELALTDDGLDRQFVFRAKRGTKYDIIDLPVTEPSLIKLFIQSESKISVYLLPPKSEAQKRKEGDGTSLANFHFSEVSRQVLAVTDPAEGTFTISVDKHEDPYRLKIEYESSPAEPCSLLTLKLAVKPTVSLKDENLSCAELHKMLP